MFLELNLRFPTPGQVIVQTDDDGFTEHYRTGKFGKSTDELTRESLNLESHLPEFHAYHRSQYTQGLLLYSHVRNIAARSTLMNQDDLLKRITINPRIFGGKPIVRGRRLAVEHVLGMLAAGDSIETVLEGYPWLEREDVQACLVYAHRLVEHERVEPAIMDVTV